MSERDEQSVEPLYPDRLTWTTLLGHWVAFARQAVGLPDAGEGRLMRASVGDVIMLQAVWFALQNVDELPADERALGVDRAGVLVQRHGEALEQRWEGHAMPATMRELIDDARGAVERARGGV
ncbi:hypothetical protein ACERK3_02050 [Phycisphaerales bacterium AB-hyl4]|uniref:Uncharacterized protein n=1 Tax=Natronomicrosphaera hydrolytica TaxID=3242702 RepID=A0ABV4U433_9BACT